jgi:hypothetical protein
MGLSNFRDRVFDPAADVVAPDLISLSPLRARGDWRPCSGPAYPRARSVTMSELRGRPVHGEPFPIPR